MVGLQSKVIVDTMEIIPLGSLEAHKMENSLMGIVGSRGKRKASSLWNSLPKLYTCSLVDETRTARTLFQAEGTECV